MVSARSVIAATIGGVIAVLLLVIVGLAYVRVTGLSARAEPGKAEARVAGMVRELAIPRGIRERRNPVIASAEALDEAMAHYADHCAVCHGNDGAGNTDMGRGLFPRPPDMRAAVTQQHSDGELFYIIEQGIRFTGMPGWGTGTADGEEASWQLVHFIRRLPHLSDAELERMRQMNPRSLEEVRQEIEEEQFLQGAP